MLNNDIKYAQKIVSGSIININKYSFHDKSFIYSFTNENLNEVYKYIKNTNKLLTVTSSGDQILNSVLAGVKDIDTFDISRFPKYYFELKKACIKVLNKDEYLNLFLGNIDDLKVDEIYNEARKYLQDDYKKFWDSLFMFFDYSEIISSSLFSYEPINKETITKNNPYLNNYEKIKKVIDKPNINHYTKNIYEALKQKKHYDLVYLSNINAYIKDDIKKLIDNSNIKGSVQFLTYDYKNKVLVYNK